MDLNSSFTGGGGDGLTMNGERSSLLASLRNEREALILRALQRAEPGVAGAGGYSTLASSAGNNDARLRALFLLQASQPSSAAAASLPSASSAQELLELQSLSRLRGAAPPQQSPSVPSGGGGMSQLEFLRQLRCSNSYLDIHHGHALGNPQTFTTHADFLEQARILQAYSTHQQALATANEAERRLNVLLHGGSAAITAPSSAAGAPRPSPPSHNLYHDEQQGKLAALEQLAHKQDAKCSPCLPPIEEGNTPHYSQRMIVPLGMEEDPNWLSERQCFIRSELLEVIRASHEEVLVRSSSKSIAYQQVGIRCRYCAHLPAGSRAIRASAFPSSIRQMYQSFTMMVRDHFGNCTGIPPDKKQRFLKLKGLTSPSSSLSRQYWAFAAKKLGMVDSEFGIMINEKTQADAAKIPPFGTNPEETKAIQAQSVEIMVQENDQNGISSYLYLLMSQAQVVHMLPSERVGKRKDAAVGLPGFGCKYCATKGRLGFCRMFPLNKRSLPDKVNDLYNHMIRCPNCPRMTKRLLESRRTEQETNRVFAERDRDFIDRIWIKLGRDCDDAFKKA